jgi:serine/threonine protein phosphatase 1
MFAWLKALAHREERYPLSPDSRVIYAIGDVHGRADCLGRAQDRIDRDVAKRGAEERASEIYIGDYIDRGPRSKEVVDLLIRRQAKRAIVALRGNHEILMDSFLQGRASPSRTRRRLSLPIEPCEGKLISARGSAGVCLCILSSGNGIWETPKS